MSGNSNLITVGVTVARLDKVIPVVVVVVVAIIVVVIAVVVVAPVL